MLTLITKITQGDMCFHFRLSASATTLALPGWQFIPRLIFQEKLNEWHGMDEESGYLKILMIKGLAQAQKLKTLHFHFSDPRSH